MKNVLAVAMMLLAAPVLADCVSCGPGGECYAVSPGFSGNCECKIRQLNGAAICRPSGVCDPGDANSCPEDGEFTEVSAPRIRISMRFLNDFAEVNPLLAGAVWAGIGEASSTRNKGNRVEVKGTMGQDGRSYTYRTEVRILPKGSASFTILVQEDGAEHPQRYEGTLSGAGRSGRFVQVGPKGRDPVFSWGAR
jgi:hypothetical protein